MRRLSFRRLLVLQRRHIGRGMALEALGYREQAARVWSSADRVTRALEARRTERELGAEGISW